MTYLYWYGRLLVVVAIVGLLAGPTAAVASADPAAPGTISADALDSHDTEVGLPAGDTARLAAAPRSRITSGSGVQPGVIAGAPDARPPRPLVSTDDHSVNPGSEAANAAKGEDDYEGVEGKGGSHVPTYAMPRVVVETERPGLREDDLIGSYKQPRWTAHRRFPATRIYVRPEGEIELEWWSRTKVKKETGETEQIHEFEVEFGLPLHFQLDLYLITAKENRGSYEVDQAIELRWSPADWGVIPLNPTLYFEYKLSGTFEAKLLLGDQIASGTFFGVNLVWEQGVYDERETVLELTGGFSYTLADSVFSVGIEFKFEIANVHSNRDFWEENLRIGPSLQFHPLEAMHVDFAPMFGLTARSRLLDMYIVVGWEF